MGALLTVAEYSVSGLLLSKLARGWTANICKSSMQMAHSVCLDAAWLTEQIKQQIPIAFLFLAPLLLDGIPCMR